MVNVLDHSVTDVVHRKLGGKGLNGLIPSELGDLERCKRRTPVER